MPIYNLAYSSTSDPKRISVYLSQQEGMLREILSNLGEENLSEELYLKINQMADDITTIKEQLQSLLGSEASEV